MTIAGVRRALKAQKTLRLISKMRRAVRSTKKAVKKNKQVRKLIDLNKRVNQNPFLRALRDGALVYGPIRAGKRVVKEVAKNHKGIALVTGILGTAGGAVKTYEKKHGKERKQAQQRNERRRSGRSSRDVGQEKQAATEDSFIKEAWVNRRTLRKFIKQTAKKAGGFVADKALGTLVGSTTAFFWVDQLNKMKKKQQAEQGGAELSNPALMGMSKDRKEK